MRRSWRGNQSVDAFYNKLARRECSVCYEKMKEMRKPECREGKERDQGMRKINRTVPTAISVKRKAHAG